MSKNSMTQTDDRDRVKRRNTTGRFFNATPDTGKRSSQPKVGPNPLPPRPTPPAGSTSTPANEPTTHHIRENSGVSNGVKPTPQWGKIGTRPERGPNPLPPRPTPPAAPRTPEE